MSEQYQLWRKTQRSEVLGDNDNVVGQRIVKTNIYIVPYSKLSEFEEFKADEYMYQDCDNIVEFERLTDLDYDELKSISKYIQEIDQPEGSK